MFIIEQIFKSEPLHVQAYQIMKTMLLTGELTPGERLIEVKLAEKLGVSRGPIREAIRMLIQDRLLIQNGGSIQVYQPTKQDLVEVFQCRESLEVLAIHLAINKISTEKQKQLFDNIEKTKEAFQESEFHEVGLLDQEFHDLIIEASENQQLIQLMESIKTKVTYIRNSILRNYYSTLHDFIGEHERIYRALVEKDVSKAEAEMRSHIKSSVEVF